jgi:hypothetical protein
MFPTFGGVPGTRGNVARLRCSASCQKPSGRHQKRGRHLGHAPFQDAHKSLIENHIAFHDIVLLPLGQHIGDAPVLLDPRDLHTRD